MTYYYVYRITHLGDPRMHYYGKDCYDFYKDWKVTGVPKN